MGLANYKYPNQSHRKISATYRIIMRNGLYIPQKKFWVFWLDLPKIPDRQLNSTHNVDIPMFYNLEVAEEFILQTLDYRKRMKSAKESTKPFIVGYYTSTGRIIPKNKVDTRRIRL